MVKFTENKKFYVTTAIAYPNSTPHLGHALEIIQADVVARFHKLLGEEVVFQTGTDEHGTKNWQTAKKQGKDIYEFLDGNVAVFKELYEKLNIEYDNFLRTSDREKHYPGAVKLWKALVKKGDIYKQKYKGNYCSGCEAFKTEKELVDGKCPNHPTKDIEIVEEENYFFRLSKYKDEIIKIIKSDEYKVTPEIRKNEILSFLKDAKDISFSRSKEALPWGIPVPDDEEQVMYVWCDALSNYITGAGYGTDDKKFESLWPADVHIIGKDILRFHAAFWPAMLLSAEVPLPKELMVHGFVLLKGAKMSKSTGNVVEPFEQIERYGSDKFRYYLARAMPLGNDGDYSEELLVERINTELVANLSNFCYRTLSFTKKNFDGGIKDIDNCSLIDEVKAKADEIKKAYEEYDFKNAIDKIMEVSASGNKYFQDSEPWKLVKENKDRTQEILGTCVNLTKILSILIKPIMPEFSLEIQKQLELEDLKWNDINFKLKNHRIGEPKIITQKVELPSKSQITKEMPLNLKVAKVLEVKPHPNADKLLVLQLDLGEEKRQLVAGLKAYYSDDSLAGKHIVIVSNLKPAKLRGELSQGMLLAGENKEGTVKVLECPDSKPGNQVIAEGYDNISNDQIDFEQFLKLKITCDKRKAFFEGCKLKTDKEDVTIDLDDKGKVR